MASTHAVAATCQAVIGLLRTSLEPEAVPGATLDFQVYVADDFRQPMDEGVSLLLYRVFANETVRTAPGRVVDGRRQRPRLPLDLHFLLTAWARTSSRQHEIAGWMMRVLEDHPTLPASLLNASRPGVFHTDEAVEVVQGELSTEDMFRIWEVMIQNVYQLSVPYVARVVEIESALPAVEAKRVGERVFTLSVPAGGAPPEVP